MIQKIKLAVGKLIEEIELHLTDEGAKITNDGTSHLKAWSEALTRFGGSLEEKLGIETPKAEEPQAPVPSKFPVGLPAEETAEPSEKDEAAS